jgi:hypothetical protein
MISEWIRTVSPDSVFCKLDIDALLAAFDQIIKNPHHCAKDMVPAVYRALVRFDVVTEAEAAVGVAQILKLRTKLLNKERLAKKREAA